MKSARCSANAWIAAASILFVASSASATMVLPVGLEQMTRESAVIVLARVDKQWTTWDDTHQRILTLSEIVVLQGIKGASKAERITVYQVGGTLDGITFKIPGAIRLTPGEEIVLFAARFRDMLVSYGMGLGKYSVRNENGVRVVSPEFGDVSFVKRNPKGRIVSAASPDSTVQPLARFLTNVRGILAGGAHP